MSFLIKKATFLFLNLGLTSLRSKKEHCDFFSVLYICESSYCSILINFTFGESTKSLEFRFFIGKSKLGLWNESVVLIKISGAYNDKFCLVRSNLAENKSEPDNLLR